MNPSINTQGAIVLAQTATDGAGSFSTTKRQQGVRDQLGTSGWSFTTDGSNGSMTLQVEPAALDTGGANANLIAIAHAYGAAAGYVCRTAVAADSIVVVVYAPATGAAIDLTATAVTIELIAAGR